MSFSAKDVMTLREMTGKGMMDCKRALEKAEGNLDAAVKVLQEQDGKVTAKAASRDAHEGQIHSYIHTGGRIGVLIEVNCETDFVARNEDFRQLCHDLCLQIVATDPICLTKTDISAERLADERRRLSADIDEKKPVEIREKILVGRVDKWFQEVCLMEQPFVKDEDHTIRQLIEKKTAQLGEKIVIARFARFELGKAF